MLQIQIRNNKKMSSASAPRSVLMGLQTKVQTLKYNRDYSFWLSDDAEVPPPPRYSQPPKPQAAGTAKLPVRGLTLEGRTSAGTGHKKVAVTAAAWSRESAMQKPAVTSKWQDLQGQVPVSKTPLLRKGETQELRNKKPTPKSAMQKTGIPSRLHPPLLSKQPLSRKGESQETKGPTTAVSSLTPKSTQQKRGVPSRLHAPISKKPFSRKGEIQETKKPTTAASSLPPKSAMQRSKGEISQKREVPKPSSNPKATHSQPLAKSSIRAKEVDDHQPKKRPRSHDLENEEELDNAISEIRKMFGYNPKKYVDDADDDRNMVANFEEIQKEENRSARIAGKEDREELRKIEEEEKREGLQKNAKKLKIKNDY